MLANPQVKRDILTNIRPQLLADTMHTLVHRR